MKTLITFFAALFIATVTFAGKPAATRSNADDRTFSVSNFDKLDLGSAFTIHVRQGGSFSVKASGRDKDIQELEASVSGGTLKIRYKDQKWGWNNRERITIDITMPTLKAADLSGATNTDIRGFKNQGSVAFDVSGASKLDMEVDADRLSIDFSGASSIVFTGKADRVEGELSGASSLRAFEMNSKTVNLSVSGASSARVSASEALNVEASGASSVRYKGGATKVSSNSSGASSVRKEG
jgi:Putative auto-transporter adhesin, head GIN domain